VKALRPHDPVRLGRYALEGVLGAGGMGMVYLGRSPGGRPAAVKVINPFYLDEPEVLARFRREAETLSTLHSPYTAALIDAELGTVPYWIATEYVPGPTLAAAVADDGPYPAGACRKLLAALAEGLADIHRHGICHRDLTPRNVILSPTGPQLIDFGLARSAHHGTVTLTGAAPGTPGYIASELLDGAELTPAADVFALGATIAHAATGRKPYGTGTLEAIYLRIVREDIDLDGVEPRLAALIRGCVGREPAARMTPADIIERCRRGPVGGEPAGEAGTGSGFDRRKLLVLSAAALFAGVPVTLGVRQYRQARHERTAVSPPVSPSAPAAPAPTRRAVRLTAGYTPPRFPYRLVRTDGLRPPALSVTDGETVAFYAATEQRHHADTTVVVSPRRPVFTGTAVEKPVVVRGRTGTLRSAPGKPTAQVVLYWPEAADRWIRMSTDDTYTPEQLVALADSLVPAPAPVPPPFRLALSPAGFVTTTISPSTVAFRPSATATATDELSIVLRRRRPLSGATEQVGPYRGSLRHEPAGTTIDVDVTDWEATLRVTAGRGLAVTDADLVRLASGVEVLDRSDPE
jgi:hypothetical protein